MVREEISLSDDNMLSLMVKMSEGNPGGATVLAQIMHKKGIVDGTVTILHLDDMNIRGTQIWVAFKDWAKGDIDVLLKGIEDRSQEMVAIVNQECLCSGFTEKAVASGGSYRDLSDSCHLPWHKRR